MPAPHAAFTAPLSDIALGWPVVASFGGGLNSTAMLAKWAVDGNYPVDLILFADTGAELPRTYDHVARFSEWLVSVGMPAVTVTKKGGRPETIIDTCLRLGVLPSIAYGKKSCSSKFKIEPQDRDVNRWAPARQEWSRGGKVIKLIGYGFEEQTRISKAMIEDEKYRYRFPLDEWQVDRQGCVDILAHIGLPVPGKSSCFICPSMTKPEITELRKEHPIQFARALDVERNAKAAGKFKSVKGLGRRFAWEDFAAGLPTADAPAVSGCMYCIDDSEVQS